MPSLKQNESAHRTAGPWRLCNDGECDCLTLTCADHPIAKVIKKDWGDDYASLRIVGGSLDAKAEPYMEQITYGHIPMEEARANARFIAMACNAHGDVVSALSGLLARYVSLVESGDAGNWDAETEAEVIAARAALAKAGAS